MLFWRYKGVSIFGTTEFALFPLRAAGRGKRRWFLNWKKVDVSGSKTVKGATEKRFSTWRTPAQEVYGDLASSKRFDLAITERMIPKSPGLAACVLGGTLVFLVVRRLFGRLRMFLFSFFLASPFSLLWSLVFLDRPLVCSLLLLLLLLLLDRSCCCWHRDEMFLVFLL